MRSARAFAVGISALALTIGLSACGSGFNSSASTAPSGSAAASGTIQVLIGSSGDSETKAVKDAVAAWSAKSGNKAEVIVASDLVQQASQGFASGKPADVLYVSTDSFAGWAKNGSLLAYGDELSNKDDFYDGLKQAFTYDGKFYCAPKDFSTLALVINETAWTEAGLTDADLPKTWEQLSAVARKLTRADRVGLGLSSEIQRAGVFMAQAGGGLVDGKKATVNSAANVEALTYLKGLVNDGSAAFSSDLGAGWGGEAFNKGKAAMVIEGNWITGAIKADAPNLKYKVAELPAGKKQGTLQFTNCWGISKDSANVPAAKSLVESLSSKDQQLAFAKAFGPMPSLKSAKDQWVADNPSLKPFVEGAAYAQNLPAMPGASDVIKEFNSQLSQLRSTDPKTILDAIQPLLEPVVAG